MELFGGLRWRPQSGDPTVVAWVVFAAYLLAALACHRAARGEAQRPVTPVPERGRWILGPAGYWRALAILLVALGLNKQLDLQTLLTEIGRRIALTGGWYESRRPMQRVFVFVLMSVAALALIVGARSAAGGGRGRRMAFLGVMALTAFVMLRASSIHHVRLDSWIGEGPAGRALRWGLELGGIGSIGIAALGASRGAAPAEE